VTTPVPSPGVSGEWVAFLGELFELWVMPGALLGLEVHHRLVVIVDHGAHVLLVQGLAMQARELLRQALMLSIKRLGNVEPENTGNGHSS
jgi:hypothetical protein